MRKTLALIALSGLAGPAAAEKPPTPAAILDYYRDHNLVTAFSTVKERQALGYSPAPLDDARLLGVERLLRSLEAREQRVDPGMARDVTPVVALRSDLLRIRDARVHDEGGEAEVELEVLTLEPPANLFLVSRYDELTRGGRQPGLDDMLELQGGAVRVLSQETHRWLRAGGVWRREATTRHLIFR
jgi:hypothetical protein